MSPMPQEGEQGRALRRAARDVTEFCALAFALSWTPHVALALSGQEYDLQPGLPLALYSVGFLGPSAAALVVTSRRGGKEQRRALLRSAMPSSSSPRRLVAAALAQPALLAAAAAAGRSRVGLTSMEPAMLLGQLWVAPNEELGWRGFLSPRLRVLTSPAVVILGTAVIWGTWHAPMFFVPGSPQDDDGVLHFGAAVFAWSAVHYLLQLRRPSVATAIAFHAAANISVSTISLGGDKHWLTAVYLLAGAVGLVIAQRRDADE